MSMTKEVVSKSAIAVLSAVALAAFWWSISKVPEAVSWIWEVVAAIFNWLVSPVWLQGWFVYLVFGYLIWKFYRFGRSYFESKSIKVPRELSIEDFTEFNCKGFKWRWNWHGDWAVDLHPYCLRCDRAARHSEDPFWSRQKESDIFCQECADQHVHHSGSYADFCSDIRIDIDLLARNGGWKRWVPESLEE